MLRKFSFVLSFFLLSFLFVLPLPAHAQDWGGCVHNGVATLQCIPIVFTNVVRAALMFAGTVALILIIYAGIRFITSGGDAKQAQGARQIMTYAIIGLVIILTSFGILYLIGYLTKTTNCITDINAMSKGGCK